MTQTTEYLIGFSAGASACMYIYRQVYALMHERKNGNGKTFTVDPDRYWESMRQNVTVPLSSVLDRQTRILEEQVKSNNAIMFKLIQLEERTRK